VGNLNEEKKKLTAQLGRAKTLLEEAQKREQELKDQATAQVSCFFQNARCFIEL
jgi:t-SNARE complex subunit (syntaxin)